MLGGGVSNDPLTGVARGHRKMQIFPFLFITVAKLELCRSNENDVLVGVTTTRGTVLKGCSIRKVENHCFTLSKPTSSDTPLPTRPPFLSLPKSNTNSGTRIEISETMEVHPLLTTITLMRLKALQP